MLSQTEENYLKAIFKITEVHQKAASTNAIAQKLDTSAASVTDMLKRLAEKEVINYEKYKGVTLTSEGVKLATQLIRRHRLWETFLVKKLYFSWDEVHEIAEELEHIKSKELVNRLDNFLGNPKFDPHGDPIPNAEGKFTLRNQVSLDQFNIGDTGVLVGVKEHDKPFLVYLNELKINLGTDIKILNKNNFDHSIKVLINKTDEYLFTNRICKSLLVKRVLN